MLANAYLQLRQMLGERKVYVVAAICAMPFFFCLLINFASTHDRQRPMELNFYLALFLFPHASCGLLALLYGSTLISSEMEAQTLTYLFTRPTPRWQVLLGKLAATEAALVVPLGISVFAGAAVLGISAASALGLMAAVFFSLAVNQTLFLFLSFFAPQRPIIVAVLYGLADLGLSFLPAIVRSATVSYHLRCLAVRVAGMEVGDAGRFVVDESAIKAVAFLAIQWVVFFLGACVIVNSRELVTAKTD